MDVGKNRPSRARSRLYSLSVKSGLALTMEEGSWNKSVDETTGRRFSDSEDMSRPVKPVNKGGRYNFFKLSETSTIVQHCFELQTRADCFY